MFIAMPFEEYLGLGFMEDTSFQDEDSVYDWEEGEDSTDLVYEEEDDE
jgi:hypothetical protein